MNEHEWRLIPEFPEYAANSAGQIRRMVPDRLGRMPSGPLKCNVHPNGYLTVSVSIGGKDRTKLAHRLVCSAFYGPAPSTQHQAAHGNGVRTDNRPENLRWATPSENSLDRWKHGTMIVGEQHHMRAKPHLVARGSQVKTSKLTEDEVIKIRGDQRPLTEIATEYGLNKWHVCAIRNHRAWRHL